MIEQDACVKGVYTQLDTLLRSSQEKATDGKAGHLLSPASLQCCKQRVKVGSSSAEPAKVGFKCICYKYNNGRDRQLYTDWSVSWPTTRLNLIAPVSLRANLMA